MISKNKDSISLMKVDNNEEKEVTNEYYFQKGEHTIELTFRNVLE